MTSSGRNCGAELFRRLAVFSVLLLVSTTLAAAQHAFGTFQIYVDADEALAAGEPDYQIVVENEELLLTRLTAPYTGKLSNSFVTDLNKDGAFEVIVTFSFDGGQQTGVHVYSWNEYRLEPRKVAELDASQTQGYRGRDEFAVSDGQLVRIFQLYEQAEGEWVATPQQRRLRYSMDEGRWLSQ